jgi:hypothetical protein
MTSATELRQLVTAALDADPAASNRTLTLSVLAQLGQVPHDQRQYERVKQALVRQRRRNENPRPWGGARPNSGPPPGNTNARQEAQIIHAAWLEYAAGTEENSET